ncbi:glyoxalase [Lewinellaceae bacterium SD302]|nr:glyoxalase [Lewinellaceae bacterium SD302]
MKIKIVSIPVRDQHKALAFYTDVLGFIKKNDIPLGGENRWLTVVSRYDQDGPELLLEPAPLHFPPSKVFQDELMKAGMPYTQFYVDSVQDEFDRLTKLGVEFSMPPTDAGTVIIAVFNDTCGNNIQLVEEKSYNRARSGASEL